MTATLRLPDRAWVPAGIALVGWSLFVGVRWWRVGDGDIGAFVVAGSDWTDPSSGLPIVEGPGYDGQFFHRLAVAPFDPAERVAGTVLDSTARVGRIGYPVLARAIGVTGLSAEWALVVVNLIVVTALGWLGGRIARVGGRHAAWGLVLAIHVGFAFTMARNLSEAVVALAVATGLWAAHTRRPLLAGALLSWAVITRETALAIVAVIALTELARIVRGHRPIARDDVVWFAPGATFLVWQPAAGSRWGTIPVLAGGTGSLRPPGVALVDQIPTLVDPSWLLDDPLHALKAAQVLVLLVVVGSALFALRRTRVGSPLTPALTGAVLGLLIVDVPEGIWLDRNDLRMFADVYVVATMVLLVSPARLTLRAVGVGACTAAAAVSFAVGL